MGLILVGTDGSQNAESAVREAADLARRLGATVLVVTVAEPVPGYLGEPHSQEWITEHHRRGQAALEQARQLAEEVGIEAELELLEGKPDEVISDLAQSRGADLVVVGTRGHGALIGDLLGSVSAGVVRHSHRPVVVVREPAMMQAEAAVESAAAKARAAPA